MLLYPAQSFLVSYHARMALRLKWVVLWCDLGSVKTGDEGNLLQDVLLDLWNRIEEHDGKCAGCYPKSSCDGGIVVAFAGIHAKDVRLDLILRTVWALVVIISDRFPPDMNTRRAALP